MYHLTVPSLFTHQVPGKVILLQAPDTLHLSGSTGELTALGVAFKQWGMEIA